MDDGRPLTDAEAAEVFRRATVHEQALAERAQGWDLPALETVGGEVGIPPEAIRRAVAEVRLGAPPVTLHGPVVRCLRIVACPAERSLDELRSWLRGELFEPVRDRRDAAVFERRRDDDARRRRARDGSGRLRLGGVERVAVAAASVPGGGSAVRVEAELERSRADLARRAAGAAALGWLAGATTVAGVSGAVGVEHVWWATPPVAAAGGWWAWRRGRDGLARTSSAVALAVDGALDRLDRF